VKVAKAKKLDFHRNFVTSLAMPVCLKVVLAAIAIAAMK